MQSNLNPLHSLTEGQKKAVVQFLNQHQDDDYDMLARALSAHYSINVTGKNVSDFFIDSITS